MVKLKDKADFSVSKSGKNLLRKGIVPITEYGLTVEDNFAAVGSIERAEHVEQCGFAAARGADNRDHLSVADRQVDAPENVYFFLTWKSI